MEPISLLTTLDSNYLLQSGGLCNMQWVMEHTAILHFCGKEKPWKPKYIRRFGILYQHYMQLTCRTQQGMWETPQ